MHEATAKNDYIEQLIKLGYGNTRSDIVDYLLKRAIDDLLRAGIVKAK